MSRSYRHSPVLAPNSNKKFKTRSNRKVRHFVRKDLHTCVDFDKLVLPLTRELSNIYDSEKDGLCKLFGCEHDPEFTKFLRK